VAPGHPHAGLRAFGSQAEMDAYHRELVEAILSKPPLGTAPAQPASPTPPGSGEPGAEPVPAPSEPPPPRVYSPPQILQHGDYLVVLREGRLSTVRIAQGALQPVETGTDALGHAADRDGMYLYGLQGTEGGVRVLAARASEGSENHVAAFGLDPDGRLRARGATVLRSTGGLYAGAHVAREMGGRVVFYDRMEIPLLDPGPAAALPMLRGPDGALQSTVDPRRVYRAVRPMSWATQPRLHVVTVCGPAGAEPACAATVLYAPEPQAVHVSATAVYLWTDHAYGTSEYVGERATLYRMPLDGSAPAALQVSGSSFSGQALHESADGHLNAHLLHGGWTETEWSQLPSPTLLRVPLSAFGDGRRPPDRRTYRRLPRLGGPFVSAFAGDWLVYGNRAHDRYMVDAGLIPATRAEWMGIGVLRWADTTPPAWLPTRVPTHAFAPAGHGAVLALVGGGDSTALTLVPPGGAGPRLAVAAPRMELWEGALRGVVPHPRNTGRGGLLALVTGVRPTPYAWRSTGVAFVRYDSTGMREAGRLMVDGEPAGDREVVPVFAAGRTFVLLGDELVEMVEADGGLREARRVPLAPARDVAAAPVRRQPKPGRTEPCAGSC
jgi:hypothetical protein